MIGSKMRVVIGAAVIAVAVGSTGTASAKHKDGCTAPDHTFATPAGTFYWDDREHAQFGDGLVDGGGSWIYMEDNNKPGLQHVQDQASILDETNLDTCTFPKGYSGKPDALLF